MRHTLVLVSFVTLLSLAGCIQNKADYTRPDAHTSVNSTVVNLPKDKAWSKLIARLGENFFVINNLDKDSGFINISYSGDPEKYVDGGVLYYMVENLAGKREYRFPAARRYQQFEMVNNGLLMTMERTVELEGRMNIVLAEDGPDKTRMTVNTRYVLTQTGKGLAVTGQPISPHVQTITFNTGGSATNQAGTVYQPNGEFEREVLALLSGE